MKAQDWTKALQAELELRGRKEGYETESNKEMEIAFRMKTLKVRPDVVWVKEGKPKIIFEIDQYAGGKYQKTIYGSILQGLVLAGEKGAIFVEVVPNDENGRKARLISETLKNQFKDLPEFHVIQARKSGAPSAKRHAQYSLKKQLDEILGAKG